MNKNVFKKMGVPFVCIVWAWVMISGTASSAQAIDSKDPATGVLEVECNMASVNLYLCPKGDYVPKETKVFFGLIKSVKHICSSEEIFVGATPVEPTPVPVGTYILMIPSDYVWEKDGPIELTSSPGEKTYFLLKLFSTRSNRPENNHGGGGGGGGGAR